MFIKGNRVAWNAQTAVRLGDKLTMVEIRQGFRSMSPQ